MSGSEHAAGRPTVVLLGRPGCHLCEDARAVLLEVRTRRGFELCEVNIDEDEELLRRYLERIPVVMLDGVELFELFVDGEALEREMAVRRSADRASGPEWIDRVAGR